MEPDQTRTPACQPFDQHAAPPLALEAQPTSLLNEIVDNMPHEANTPLTIIMTNTHLLAHTPDTDAAKREQHKQRIYRQVTHIKNLVDVMQVINKLDRFENLDHERMAPDPLLRECVRLAQAEADRRAHTIATDLKAEAALDGHAHLLQAAFLSLINNAIQFTPDGGQLCISSRVQDDALKVVIRDNGIGVHPDALPRLADPFYRELRLETSQGFGLGLTLANHIIAAHEGRLFIRSALGEGTQVSVRLPLATR